MTRPMIFALVGLLVAIPCLAQAPSATEQEVLKLERVLNEAYIRKDRATLERLIADDYLYVHSNGTVSNKPDGIRESMSPDFKWTSRTLDGLKARTYEDVVVVTGVTVETWTGSAMGYVAGARRTTNIWVRRNGQWQIVGGQATLMPAK